MPTLFQSPAKKVLKPALATPESTTRMGPFTSFARHPAHIHFETQEEQERVVLFLRQHFIVNLGWVLVSAAMILAPIVFFPFIFAALDITIAVPSGYIAIGTLFWYLGIFGFVLAKFLEWFFNIYIVTNERLVDIDFYHLLYKRFSQTELSKIQDLSYISGGVVAAFFNYGDVHVQTAGEVPNIDFAKVPYPEKVVETIRELTEDATK